jgi:hypothetical protein
VAYNHFTALALETGLARFFKGSGVLRLAVFSDERSGHVQAAAGAAPRSDGFARALRLALAAAAARGYGGPRVAAQMPVSRLSGDAGGAFTPEQELLQLTDLLLGAASTAIAPQTVAATKRWFGRRMADVMEDVRRPAGPKSLGLRGRVLVSYFPDPLGRIYHDGPIGIREP